MIIPPSFTRPILLTPRLRGEPVMRAHAAFMAGLLADELVYQFLESGPPSRDTLENQYQFLEAGTNPDRTEYWLTWILFCDETSAVGFVQATIRDDKTADVSYVLGSAYQGRGYAREAVSALLDLLFREFPVVTAIAEIDARNVRSVSLVRHLGFVHSGTQPNSLGFPEETHRLDASTWSNRDDV